MKTAELKILVGSNNPVKINAAKEAFEKAFSQHKITAIGQSVASGVREQPMSIEETKQGAANRVGALKTLGHADFFIAYEGGIDASTDEIRTFAILCVSDGEKTLFGQTATLAIPTSVYQRLEEGIELGTAMDELFNTVNIKQKGGAIGQLTKGLETRQSIYTSATLLALAPILHPSLY